MGGRGDVGRAPGEPDPIFQGEEPVERAPRRTALLFQFFLFPLMIVVASVGVFLLFGAIGGSERDPVALLDAVVSGGENVQKQAVQDLAVRITEERRRVDAGQKPAAEAFYQSTAFQRRLLDAYTDAVSSRKGAQREQALVVCLGAVGSPAFVPALTQALSPARDPEVRRAAAMALGAIGEASVVEPLKAALSDPDDAVRAFAVQALSRTRVEEAQPALRAALANDFPLVRVAAASALAIRGDDAGRAFLLQLLDPAWVQQHVVEASTPGGQADPSLRRSALVNALANGIRGAHGLSRHAPEPELRARVEALRSHGDREVADLAATALEQWGKAP